MNTPEQIPHRQDVPRDHTRGLAGVFATPEPVEKALGVLDDIVGELEGFMTR